jgi:hypothetical protein
MNKARSAIDSLLARDGKHDTSVHEIIKPAVEHEEVIRTQREEMQTAVDREVHQDHYHTSVQPVSHREVLPEEHIDRVAALEHRNFQHGNPELVKQRLAAEAAQFKNTRNVSETEHTSTTSPAIVGEHVHHHVHEIVQPVVQKETIQPSVIHHTIPIHEVHQNEAKPHTATQLPAVTMDEFKRQGGCLTGREEHTDSFEGEPKSVGGTLGGARAAGTTSLTENEPYTGTGSGRGATTTTHTGTGTSGTGLGTRTTESDSTTAARTAASAAAGTSAAGATTTGATGASTTGTSGAGGSFFGGDRSHTHRGSTSSGSKRHGLMDRLNPMKSSVDEGSRGFGGTVR